MARTYPTRPFKTRARRGIPDYVAIAAVLMLAVTVVPGFDRDGDGERMQAAPRALPAAGASSEARQPSKHKLNVRLSLFRHG